METSQVAYFVEPAKRFKGRSGRGGAEPRYRPQAPARSRGGAGGRGTSRSASSDLRAGPEPRCKLQRWRERGTETSVTVQPRPRSPAPSEGLRLSQEAPPISRGPAPAERPRPYREAPPQVERPRPAKRLPHPRGLQFGPVRGLASRRRPLLRGALLRHRLRSAQDGGARVQQGARAAGEWRRGGPGGRRGALVPVSRSSLGTHRCCPGAERCRVPGAPCMSPRSVPR